MNRKQFSGVLMEHNLLNEIEEHWQQYDKVSMQKEKLPESKQAGEQRRRMPGRPTKTSYVNNT